jgi:prepilin-type N-terminal cleavage/methylation domain-containing protein
MYVKKRPKPGGRDAGAGRLNNRGLTLVEIVVVVAILAIASSIVWMSINTIFGLEAKKTAKELYGAIEKVKVQQMTKAGASYLHLYRLDGAVCLDIYDSGEKRGGEFEDGNKIGTSRIRITYTLGGHTVTLDEEGIVLAFNRSDGSFMTAGAAWDLRSPAATPDYPGSYYTAITISSGGFNRTITLFPNTGKIEYGNEKTDQEQ